MPLRAKRFGRSWRLACLLPAVLAGGCVHRTADPQVYEAACPGLTKGVSAEEAATGIFIVTTRMLDCRGTRPPLLSTGRRSEPAFAVGVAPRAGRWPGAVHLTGQQDWENALGVRLRASGGRLLLFVHGYNNTPAQVFDRTAAIVARTGFAGPAVAFTWPSRGDTLHYTWDEENVAWTRKRLRDFVSALVKRQPHVRMVLVSHSMGNRAALDLAATLPETDGARIEQMILASPDVDRELFAEELELVAKRVPRITVYASFHDLALKTSWNVHGAPRAGDPSCRYDLWRRNHRKAPQPEIGLRTCYPVLPDGVDLVDTSGVSSGIGHADFVESDIAAEDLCRTLAQPPIVNPARRAVTLPDGGRRRIFYLDRRPVPDVCATGATARRR